MFLQLCVILFTGALCPSMHHRSHDRGSLFRGSMSRGVSVWESLSGGSLSRGSLSRGVSVWGLCPGERGSLSRGDLCPGGSLSRGSLCPGESLSRGVSVQELSVQGVVSVWGSQSKEGLCQGDPHTVTSGQYASYWNAFLLYYCYLGHIQSYV